MIAKTCNFENDKIAFVTSGRTGSSTLVQIHLFSFMEYQLIRHGFSPEISSSVHSKYPEAECFADLLEVLE